MASAPSPPTPPDPTTTASAQAEANAGTATAQTALNNANQVTPLGNVNYSVTGSQSYTNPDGSTSTVPTYTETQTLSPQEQGLFNQQVALGSKENSIAGNALTNVGNTLSNPTTAADLSPLQLGVGKAPALATGYDQGGQIATSFNPGGAVQTGYGAGGQIQDGYNEGGPIQSSIADPSQFAGQAQDLTQSVLQRLQPQIDQQNAATASQLANQGISTGSAAYNAVDQENQANNNNLMLGAVSTGDLEQQQLYGEALAGGQFTNSAQAQQNSENAAEAAFGNAAQQQRNTQSQQAAEFADTAQQQQYAENQGEAEFGNSAQAQQNQENQQAAGFGNAALTQGYDNSIAGATFHNQAAGQQLSQDNALQNQEINEISALMGGGQVSMPSFQGYSSGQVGTTPISADTYASANLAEQNYNSQVQQTDAFNSGLFGLGSSAMGMFKFSDRRLKRDVRPIGRIANGLTVYSWRYVTDAAHELPVVGLMADEVARVRPEAVAVHPSGFLMVDYELAKAA